MTRVNRAFVFPTGHDDVLGRLPAINDHEIRIRQGLFNVTFLRAFIPEKNPGQKGKKKRAYLIIRLSFRSLLFYIK